MLANGLGKVGDVQVGRVIIALSLQAGIEALLFRESGLQSVSKINSIKRGLTLAKPTS